MWLDPDGASPLRSLRSDVRHYDVVHRVHNVLTCLRVKFSPTQGHCGLVVKKGDYCSLSEGQRTAERRALIGVSQKKWGRYCRYCPSALCHETFAFKDRLASPEAAMQTVRTIP